MFILKISVFVAYAVVVCQMNSTSAAPARPATESLTDRLALMDYEAQRLFSAIIRNIVLMTAEEMEPTEEENSKGRFLSKRCTNLSTCVLGKLSQELHKLQMSRRRMWGWYAWQETQPAQSSVTAQKRACNTATCVTHRLADFLSRSGGIANNNFIPTNVGSKAFGRRREKHSGVVMQL